MSAFAGLALDTETPHPMPIRHPATGEVMRDGLGREAFLSLLSSTSIAAQRARATVTQRRVDAGVRRLKQEDVERDAIEVLAACTKGWHLVTFGGQSLDVPFSESAAIELYGTAGMRYLLDQATAFADSAGNFLPTSSMT